MAKEYIVEKLNKSQKEVLSKYFIGEDGYFNFEGCWFRNQRPENASKSGYIDSTTQRRRYIHFYDSYKTDNINGQDYLVLAKYYLYVTNTLPIDEVVKYENKIFDALKIGGFRSVDDGRYINDNDTEVIITKYKNHPRNTNPFPDNYESIDIVVCSKGYDYADLQDRIWKLSRKTYRLPDKREHPKYTKDVRDILDYLPAQVEMGCGPSIDANIPPLHNMHETYKVQNHETGCFYLSEQDDLLVDVISNEKKMRLKFAEVPMACFSADLTDGYKTFGELYKLGYFKGVVYNNNFDRIVKRMGIPEKILRIYDINEYIARPVFEDDVKSLICMGCHADRRQVERQARERGLKIIFIDPEGYETVDGFEEYLVEGPKDDDIIVKMRFDEAMTELKKVLLNGEKNTRV